MDQTLIKLKWSRPDTVEYPKVWRTFQARGLDSDKLVEYRIQDLPESRFEDVIDHMVTYFIPEEPVNAALNAKDDKEFVELCKLAYRSALHQNTTMVCFREGSDDIVGVQINFVLSKDDKVIEDLFERSDNQKLRTAVEISKYPALYNNFDPFEQYGVTEYFSELGLSVASAYRGRRIGYHLLDARKEFCQAFGIKVSPVFFSSDISNHYADEAGYELNCSISFDEMNRLRPDLGIQNIKSKEMTLKTLICCTL